MLIELVTLKRKPGARGKPPKLGRFRCDHCGIEFELKNPGKYTEHEFHFHSNECVNASQRGNGVLKRKKEAHFETKYGPGITNPYGAQEVVDRWKQAMLEKHGTDNPSKLEWVKRKKEATCTEHFGVSNPQQSSEIRERTAQTCIERYGTTSFLGTQDARDAHKQWSLDAYGVEHPMKSEQFLEEVLKPIFVKKYGVDNPMKSPEVQAKGQATLERKYGVDNPGKLQSAIDGRRRAFEEMGTSSAEENRFYTMLVKHFGEDDVLRQAAIEYSHNKFWFIDFYIASLKLFVHYDGMFWHGLTVEHSELKRRAENSEMYRSVLHNRRRDHAQDAWFNKMGLNFVRITDEQFNTHGFDPIAVILDAA